MNSTNKGMNANKPSKETLKAWSEDPANWKWGIFYFNKEDKRIFPPKKVAGLGWTINFGNPYSILSFVVGTTVLVIALNLLSNFFK